MRSPGASSTWLSEMGLQLSVGLFLPSIHTTGLYKATPTSCTLPCAGPRAGWIPNTWYLLHIQQLIRKTTGEERRNITNNTCCDVSQLGLSTTFSPRKKLLNIYVQCSRVKKIPSVIHLSSMGAHQK